MYTKEKAETRKKKTPTKSEVNQQNIRNIQEQTLVNSTIRTQAIQMITMFHSCLFKK